MRLQIQQLLLLQLPLFFLFLLFDPSSSVGFNCTGQNTKCQAMAGYKTANSTTYSSLMTLFQVQSLNDLLGANNLPTTTPPSLAVLANTIVRIPFPCACSNGTGLSDKRPIYTVKKDDGLYTIAVEIFGGFVTYQDVATLNGVKDVNLINVGQKLWVPLPCSCDTVEGADVVHYAHKVANGSTVEGIAAEFGTTEATLLKLNGISDPTKLKADSVLDVPLRACNSSIRTDSLDRGLLVPNGTYALTANDCVKCNCSYPAYQLICMPSINATSTRSTCPAATCANGNLTIGSTIPLSTSACEATTCAYAGYNHTTIFTILANTSTCPVGASGPGSGPSSAPAPAGNSATSMIPGWQRLGWMELLVLSNLIVFSCGLL